MKKIFTVMLFLASALPLAAQEQRSIFAGFDWSFRAPAALGIDGAFSIGSRMYGTVIFARVVNLPTVPTFQDPATDLRAQIIPTLRNVRSMTSSDLSFGIGAGYRLVAPLMVSATLGLIDQTRVQLGDQAAPDGKITVMRIDTETNLKPSLGLDGHLFLVQDQVKLNIGYDTGRGWRAGLALGF